MKSPNALIAIVVLIIIPLGIIFFDNGQGTPLSGYILGLGAAATGIALSERKKR